MHNRHPWRSALGALGFALVVARLCGWSWDKIWRHYAAWLVILFAAAVGFHLLGDVWLTIYGHVPHVLLLLGFVGRGRPRPVGAARARRPAPGGVRLSQAPAAGGRSL